MNIYNKQCLLLRNTKGKKKKILKIKKKKEPKRIQEKVTNTEEGQVICQVHAMLAL